MARKRVYLVDGSAMAYRSHFAFIRRPLLNSEGMNTSASYGFVTQLLSLRDQHNPDLLVVIFDGPEKTFRHERYPEYKATREKMPEDMREQLPYIDRIVEGLGVPVLRLSGYEADDIIGTLAKQGEEAGHEVFLVTGDKDFMQLVTERVKIYNPWSKAGVSKLMGPKEVEKKFGVGPELVRDVLALMGDKSDNIPGVPSIGEKTALKLIHQFGSLEEVLAKKDEVKAKRARENLISFEEQARLSYELVTIDVAAPVEPPLAELVNTEPDRETLMELFTELEFQALHRRFSATVENTSQDYRLVNSDALFAELKGKLAAAEEFVFDLETTGLEPLTVEIVGFSFSCETGIAYYIPATVETKSKVGETASLFPVEESSLSPYIEGLRAIFADPKKRKGGQNIKYDLLVLEANGIEVNGVAFDTLIESYLLDPSARTHGLDDLALRYLSYRKIATKELIGRGKNQKTMAELPVAQVMQYACEDADITFRLHQIFRTRLAEQPVLQKLYEDVELPLMQVLKRMEQAGVALDTEMLGGLDKEFEAKETALKEKAHELAGEKFNLNSPKQLREILYDRLEVHKVAKVRPRRTTTGDMSTDVSVLERLAEHHPLPRVILDYRGFAKLRSTYVVALPKLIVEKTGRVHTSFNQAVAATGRLSSSDPNLQNIPIRTPEGQRIRGAFVAGHKGWELISADYSQIELRLLAHFSEEEALIEAFQGDADIHRATAARIFELPAEEVSSELRSKAKAINFGIIYGMGASRLARQTGMSTEEAKEFIDNYFATYPKVRAYLDGQIALAESQGYVETILGRRRDLSGIQSDNRQIQANAERMAVNTPIQGSAADHIKVAMINIDRRLQALDYPATMLLQVHDELIFETPAEHVAALTDLVREEMAGAFTLLVPLKVDIGHGHSWLEAH